MVLYFGHVIFVAPLQIFLPTPLVSRNVMYAIISRNFSAGKLFLIFLQ